MKKDETTRSLSKVLEQVRAPHDAERFITEYTERTPLLFYQYINILIAEKNIPLPEVISNSGISKNYVYNILNGTRRNPGRDKVIALCIGARANYRQLQRALELANVPPLYPKSERDARIAIAVNNGVNNVTSLNYLLDSFNLEPLDI